jgi:hypothetical protein
MLREIQRMVFTFAMCKRESLEIYHEVRTALIAHGSLSGEYYPQGVALGYPIMPRWGGRPALQC